MKYFKAAIFLPALIFLACTSFANTYYFSSSQGNDARSSAQAQQQATPWKSLNKLNEVMNSLSAGDSILFKRGDVFTGSMNITVSGTAGAYIVFTSYGQGDAPVISGFTKVTGWTPSRNGIWEAPLNAQQVNMLMVNGQVKAKGRYPNTGFLTLENTNGYNQLTDDQLQAVPNWTGGHVVIRKTHWVLDSDSITTHAGNTINFISTTSFGPSKNYGYFIQDHPLTLDLAGEWYFDAATQKLFMCFDASDPAQSNIQAANGAYLVQIHSDYLRFSDLVFEGANSNAFQLDNAHQVQLINCNILYSGINAIDARNSGNMNVEACSIRFTNNIAVSAINCSGNSFTGNNIFATGIFPGMGQNNSGSYEAMLVNGDDNTIEKNTIDSTGYIPISFNGSNVRISNNFIRSFAFVKDDGSAIYTWNNASGASPNTGREISGNIILDGRGAGSGTDDPASARAHGIYLDDNSANININDNSVANCNGSGIFIHNAHELNLTRNTLFSNHTQLTISHDNFAPNSPVRNIRSTNNIFFSQYASQRVAEFMTIGNDIGSFGFIDSNYYLRPVEDDFTIYASWNANGSYQGGVMDLNTWQWLHHHDLHSSTSPVRIAAYRINALTSGNLYSNGDFSTGIGGLYAYADNNNVLTSWTNGAGLDDGALKLEFIAPANSHAYLVIRVGQVVAGQNYILRFSLRSNDEHKAMQCFLRQSLSPYNDLSERKLCRIPGSRTENEFMFTVTQTESDASILFELEYQQSPVYFDNLQLYEANVIPTNPSDSMRFDYNNSTSPKTVTLDGSYIDARKNIFTGSITLAPFASAALIRLQGISTLPVDVFSFRGVRVDDKVRLQWSTGTVTGSGYFDVERSGDATAFTRIGRVARSISNAYTYVDVQPLQGANYYRLHYGTSYSNIVRIDLSRTKKNLKDLLDEDMTLRPNPASASIQISINALPITLPVTVSVIAGNGSIVKTVTTYLRNNQLVLDIASLAPGVYSLRFVADSKSLVKSFVKTRR